MRRLLFPHLALWLLGAAVIRVAVVPAEICPPATSSQVSAAAAAAGDWLVRGLDDDGRFLYGYDRGTDRINPAYSIVRHGGTTVALYQLASQADERFLAPAETALAWMMDRVVETGEGAAAVADPGADARLGTTAFAIVALIERRALTGDTTYDDLMRRFGRFILAQRDGADGLLALWDARNRQPVPNVHGPFATGEALWALAEIDRVFPGEGWAAAALPTMRYLASGERERREGYLSRLPDHWAAYALEALDPALLDDELIAYAGGSRATSRYGCDLSHNEPDRASTSWCAGIRDLRPVWERPVRRWGCCTCWRNEEERLADLVPEIRERLTCMGGYMADRQIDLGEATVDPRPELSRGAWFYRDYTQIDGQQHLNLCPPWSSHGNGGRPVSIWFVYATYLAAVNPARLRPALPQRKGRIRWAATLSGATATLVAGFFLVAVSTDLLDALDITPETWRIAAGSIATLVGLRVLAAPLRAEEPQLHGRWAALVPVAFPLLITPSSWLWCQSSEPPSRPLAPSEG